MRVIHCPNRSGCSLPPAEVKPDRYAPSSAWTRPLLDRWSGFPLPWAAFGVVLDDVVLDDVVGTFGVRKQLAAGVAVLDEI